MKLLYILGGIVSIMVFFFIFVSLTRENRFARKGQKVICDREITNKIEGVIVYEQDDYIIISGKNQTFMGFTGGVEIYHKCEGCTDDVRSVELSGAVAMYETTYSENIIMKKFECIRQGRYKNKDIINRVKMYEIE